MGERVELLYYTREPACTIFKAEQPQLAVVIKQTH